LFVLFVFGFLVWFVVGVVLVVWILTFVRPRVLCL